MFIDTFSVSVGPMDSVTDVPTDRPAHTSPAHAMSVVYKVAVKHLLPGLSLIHI